MTPKVKARNGPAVFADIAANWSSSSMLMGQLLASGVHPYMHVLQPNQYYTTRAFSEDEKKVALNDGSPFKPGAQQGYPFLEKTLEPGALNALHIFDHERAPVYIDDCCHYTLTGNRLLADCHRQSRPTNHASRARMRPSTTNPVSALPPMLVFAIAGVIDR